MSEVIGVCGARGQVGSATMAALHAAGERPVALVRSDEAAAEIAGPSVEVRIADFLDPAQLRGGLDGLDRVLLCSSHGPMMATAQVNVIEAAVSADVRRIVKISASPASIFPGTPAAAAADHLMIEERLRATELENVAIRPNAFAQGIIAWAGPIEAGTLPLPLGDATLSWVDVGDVGAVAAKLLLLDELVEEVVTVTGPERLSGEELADLLSELLGHKVRYQPLDDQQLREKLLSSGASEWLADHVVSIFALLRERDGGEVSDAVERYVNRPATPLRSVLPRILGGVN